MATQRRPFKVLQVAAIDATIAAFVVPLIDALQADGYCVESACADGPKAEALRLMGYTVHRVAFCRRVLSFSHVGALAELVSLMRRNRYDVIHVHTPIASVLGRIGARLAGVPIVVYTAHGFYFHDRLARAPRRVLIWIERLLCRRFTDFLFTVSCEDRDTAIRERIMPAESMHCLGSVGVNLSRFSGPFAIDSIRREFGLEPEERVICFVGRVVKEKGILDLACAMAQVKKAVHNAKLLVVGDTLPSDRTRGTSRKLKDLLKRAGLENAVVFAGYREDIPAILSICDLLVLPSHREGMPVTVLEAMAAARPIVATNIRGCREEVVDGVTGLLVPPGDPKALADAITSILADPERAKEMGEEGQRRVEAEFRQERVIAEQVAVYNRLVRKKLAPEAAEETRRCGER